MKRKFFLQRAALFFAVMLIPALTLFASFMAVSFSNAQHALNEKGMQTVASVMDNCETMINGFAQQNDLLTCNVRMTLSLDRALNQVDMLYGDVIFLSALGTMLRTIVDTNDCLDNMLVWLDGAPRVFSSQSNGIQQLTQLEDIRWLESYKNMPADQQDLFVRQTTGKGHVQVACIHRLPLQDGCFVVFIDAQKWSEKLTTLLQRSREHLFVLTEEGKILVHATNDPVALDATDDYMETLFQAEDGEWIQTTRGQYMKSSGQMEGIRVISAVSRAALMDSLYVLLQAFLVILLVNLCVVMLLAYITTKRISDQMAVMIDMLDNALKGLPVERPVRKIRDEYDVVMNNILYMYLRDSALRAELQEKQYQKEHAERMALQLQINPHFLYNTLQTLDIAIRGGSVDRYDLCDVIRSVSGILKYALGSPQEPVALRDEIHYLKEYASVQKFRFGDRFILYYEVDEELMDCQVFRLMVQPLVENSMLHGLRELSKRGYIWVRIEAQGKEMKVSVKDSGAGMKQEELEKLREQINSDHDRSIGLVNLNRRLRLHYGAGSTLCLNATPGEGMEVSFRIPRVQKKEVSSDVLDDKK